MHVTWFERKIRPIFPKLNETFYKNTETVTNTKILNNSGDLPIANHAQKPFVTLFTSALMQTNMTRPDPLMMQPTTSPARESGSSSTKNRK